jgi:hypothetical protein
MTRSIIFFEVKKRFLTKKFYFSNAILDIVQEHYYIVLDEKIIEVCLKW